MKLIFLHIFFTFSFCSFSQVKKEYLYLDSASLKIDRKIQSKVYPDGMFSLTVLQEKFLIRTKYKLYDTPKNISYYTIKEINKLEGAIEYLVNDSMGTESYIVVKKNGTFLFSFDRRYYIGYSGTGLKVKTK